MASHPTSEEATHSHADPLEDGRTRCDWVRGHSRCYAFHDAEWGMFADDEGFAQERLLLAAMQRFMPLTDVVAHRDEIWTKLHKWDLAKIGAMDDAAIDAIAKDGGSFADRARLVWIRDVAAAGAETSTACKGLKEYFLAVRWYPPEDLIADMTARFPGFTRQDAANLCAMTGSVAGSVHERDCWKA